jgi:hypothetical protein
MKQDKYDITILGFGISSFCFLLYLYNNNLLSKYNILILEKHKEPCLKSLDYKNVNSNSTLGSLIEPFRVNIFNEIISQIDKDHDLNKYINLKAYSKIIRSIANTFLRHLESLNNITVKLDHNITNISHSNHNINIDQHQTKTCIISLGAEQDLSYIQSQDTENILHNKTSKCILPEEIFNRDNFKLFNGKKIAIIGSSHSSISIADALISNKVNYEKISLLCRNKIKVFFESRESATENGFPFKEDEVCTETQTVNRFDGLRENSKYIYMNLNKFRIDEICNKKISCEDYDIIVPCWGYRKRIPKINNTKHSEHIDSNKNFELTIKEKEYKNIFLFGISSKPKIEITQKSFTKSVDGVWLYYNLLSEQLYKNILNGIKT